MKVLTLTLFMLILIGCKSQGESRELIKEEGPQKITLVREYQKTHRYNCDAELISMEYEIIVRPRNRMNITPKTNLNLFESVFRNITTEKSVSGSGKSISEFTIDMAPTVSNLRVREGINQINYAFFYCYDNFTDNDGVLNCAHSSEMHESGQIEIDVEYIEKTIEGIRVVRPFEDECLQLKS